MCCGQKQESVNGVVKNPMLEAMGNLTMFQVRRRFRAGYHDTSYSIAQTVRPFQFGCSVSDVGTVSVFHSANSPKRNPNSIIMLLAPSPLYLM